MIINQRGCGNSISGRSEEPWVLRRGWCSISGRLEEPWILQLFVHGLIYADADAIEHQIQFLQLSWTCKDNNDWEHRGVKVKQVGIEI